MTEYSGLGVLQGCCRVVAGLLLQDIKGSKSNMLRTAYLC